jgi:hypothetical protein
MIKLTDNELRIQNIIFDCINYFELNDNEIVIHENILEMDIHDVDWLVIQEKTNNLLILFNENFKKGEKI